MDITGSTIRTEVGGLVTVAVGGVGEGGVVMKIRVVTRQQMCEGYLEQ